MTACVGGCFILIVFVGHLLSLPGQTTIPAANYTLPPGLYILRGEI